AGGQRRAIRSKSATPPTLKGGVGSWPTAAPVARNSGSLILARVALAVLSGRGVLANCVRAGAVGHHPGRWLSGVRGGNWSGDQPDGCEDGFWVVPRQPSSVSLGQTFPDRLRHSSTEFSNGIDHLPGTPNQANTSLTHFIASIAPNKSIGYR